MTTPVTVRSLLSQDNVKSKFKEVLHEKANGFTANLAVMVNNNAALSKCEPMSIISAAVVSASLDLPLDPNLGFAAIVPYNCKVKGINGDSDKWVSKAQFQMMYKGFVQLAMRSGQYKTIGASPIYNGQLISENPLAGEYEFDFSKQSDKVIGYAAYFKLLNGFEKTIYWDIEKVTAHGKKFSKSFNSKKPYGLWVDDFDAMAIKTVLKLLLSKWGVLSIEMQKAVQFDQSVIKENDEVEDIDYVDAPTEQTPLDKKEDLKNKKLEGTQGKTNMP